MITIRPAGKLVTLDSPVEHLHACHRRIEERLATLERAGEHLLDRPEEALAAIKTAFWFFDSNGVYHTADEEESFFPRLSGKLTASEELFLAALETEHAEAEAIYAELKKHTASMGASPSAADQARYTGLAARLGAHYRRHIASEDAHFGQLAEHLTPSELQAISEEMKQRRGL